MVLGEIVTCGKAKAYFKPNASVSVMVWVWNVLPKGSCVEGLVLHVAALRGGVLGEVIGSQGLSTH
jgi:hypothetical protein